MKTLLRLPHAFLLLVALFAIGSVAVAAETVLYDKPSKYNNIIVTEDEEGLRVLRFEKGGARQTIAKPGHPQYLGFAYTKVAFVGLALAQETQRMMIVGVGGGTMPVFLRHYYPKAEIDAVDIDPDVVHVAKKYFGLREDERLKVHVGDGRAFVEAARKPYDIVFLDAFGTRNVPPHLTTVEFMRAVRSAVKPSGVVVWNIWGRVSNPLYDSMVRTASVGGMGQSTILEIVELLEKATETELQTIRADTAVQVARAELWRYMPVAQFQLPNS